MHNSSRGFAAHRTGRISSSPLSITRMPLTALIALIAAVLVCAADARAGVLWASGSTPSRIYRIDSVTGALLGTFNGPGSFSDAVVVDNSGTFLHIADSSPGATSRIWRTSTIGTVI